MPARMLILIGILMLVNPVSVQGQTTSISLTDTTEFGSFLLYAMDGWRFSNEKPVQIRNGENLKDSEPVDIRDLSSLRSTSLQDNYGWFELAIEVDSSVAGEVWILSHRGHAPVNIWLNGKLILRNGTPSPTREGETLARFLNPATTGFTFTEGVNYMLLEYSSHQVSNNLTFRKWFNDGIHLVLYDQYEPYQRRHRAAIFGGAFMLLLLLATIQAYLAVTFRGSYHFYIFLTTFSMLLLVFTTLSDTLIDWSYAYLPFFEISYVSTLTLISYSFMISVRKITDLTVPWRTLSSLGVLFIGLGIISVYTNRSWLNTIHPVMIGSALVYVIYSLWESKKKNPDSKIWIIAAGLLCTVIGALLYILPYMALGMNSHMFFIISMILTFTGIPAGLTFNVVSNYVELLSTLENKVQERTADLAAANQYQKRFFANISHEFRTPLTITDGLINKMILEKEEQQTDEDTDLEMIQRNMSRLHDMVDQIIELTKSDQQQVQLKRAHYKADELATIAVESFRSLAEHHHHTFHFEACAGDAVIFVDRPKVEIMINNLISNAIKFTAKGGRIEIKTTAEDGFFRLTVSDNGIGIPEGEEEIIFERFHRIKRDESDYVEGMGVGLELSRSLATLHQGDIRVTEGSLSGASFELSLPLSEIESDTVTLMQVTAERKRKANPATAEDDQDDQHFDILLVEDNEDMMHYVADILSRIGTVIPARNGKEALEILSGYTPDIIITDLMMPVLSGQKLVEALRKNKKWESIPVIVLTARALEEDKLHLLRVGVVDYITKPFMPEQLLLKTRNLLTYYNRRKKLKIGVSVGEIPDGSERLSEKAAAFIMKHITNTELSVDALAAACSQSRSAFYRNIQIETGMSPAEFIREVRLTAARAMIAKNSKLTLEELSDSVGYKSATSFRKKYEERFGEHPLK